MKYTYRYRQTVAYTDTNTHAHTQLDWNENSEQCEALWHTYQRVCVFVYVCVRNCVYACVNINTTNTQGERGKHWNTVTTETEFDVYTYRAFSNPSAIVWWKFSAKFLSLLPSKSKKKLYFLTKQHQKRKNKEINLSIDDRSQFCDRTK